MDNDFFNQIFIPSPEASDGSSSFDPFSDGDPLPLQVDGPQQDVEIAKLDNAVPSMGGLNREIALGTREREMTSAILHSEEDRLFHETNKFHTNRTEIENVNGADPLTLLDSILGYVDVAEVEDDMLTLSSPESPAQFSNTPISITPKEQEVCYGELTPYSEEIEVSDACKSTIKKCSHQSYHSNDEREEVEVAVDSGGKLEKEEYFVPFPHEIIALLDSDEIAKSPDKREFLQILTEDGHVNPKAILKIPPQGCESNCLIASGPRSGAMSEIISPSRRMTHYQDEYSRNIHLMEPSKSNEYLANPIQQHGAMTEIISPRRKMTQYQEEYSRNIHFVEPSQSNEYLANPIQQYGTITEIISPRRGMPRHQEEHSRNIQFVEPSGSNESLANFIEQPGAMSEIISPRRGMTRHQEEHSRNIQFMEPSGSNECLTDFIQRPSTNLIFDSVVTAPFTPSFDRNNGSPVHSTQETPLNFEIESAAGVAPHELKAASDELISDHGEDVNNGDYVDGMSKCKKCDDRFLTAEGLRRHSICHGDDAAIACSFCEGKFMSNVSLSLHKRRVHGIKRVSYEKGKQLKAKEANAALNDSEGESRDTDPRIQCPQCSKMIFSKSNLTRHLKTVHLNLRNYQCKYCSETFPSNQNLKLHIMKIHTHVKKKRVKGEPYVCDTCAARYTTSGNLSRHKKLKKH